jgi:hypothetical protein
MALKDEKGLLNQIVDVLQTLKLNILSEVSGVSGEHFYVELVVSGKDYRNDYDGTHTTRCDDLNKTLRYLETVLIGRFLSRLRLITVQQGMRKSKQVPDLRIDRMRTLYNIHEEYRENVADTGFFKTSTLEVHTEEDDDAYWIEVKKDWHDELLTACNYDGDCPEMTYVASSSARNQLLTLTFLKADKQWGGILIDHNDRVGAIYTFTDAIKQQVNITASATVKLNVDRNLWEFWYETEGPSPIIPPKEIVTSYIKHIGKRKRRKYDPKPEIWTGNGWEKISLDDK